MLEMNNMSNLINFLLLLVSVDTKSLTFINENESSVRLKQTVWKSTGKLHFKLITNGDDGTVLTAINQNNEKLQLELSKGTFKLKIGDKFHYIPGITNKKLVHDSWNDLYIEQVGKALHVHINGFSVVLPLYRKRQWLMDNWKEVNLGTTHKANDEHSSNRYFFFYHSLVCCYIVKFVNCPWT